ncbi:MAG: c-type cytochrome [Chitinophagaceae bacterium]|nr:c-type cytochrome [Chitinophagaceae bacterium]
MDRRVVICLLLGCSVCFYILTGCGLSAKEKKEVGTALVKSVFILPDTSLIPNDMFGEEVRYGRQLLLNTAYYIGPNGTKGHYLRNRMNCTNCHQDAGVKPYSFNLLSSHDNYPQYRAREGKILTLAERVNNCIMRPHNGKPLPLDSREMVAILSYLKWINSFAPKGGGFEGAKNMAIQFPAAAASPKRGKEVFTQLCASCHGNDGSGQLNSDGTGFIYPPLWGGQAYQPGSSMHRIIKMARWLKANMPYNKVTTGKPFLTDQQALDVAAFINDDDIHDRPNPKSFDYPDPVTKPIDYDRGPFADSFPSVQHKFGPYQPIIDYRKTMRLPVDY